MYLVIACICLAFFGVDASGDPGYTLNFPNKGVTDYVNIWGMRSLTQFTICFWIKTSDTDRGTPFSYAVSGKDNELIIYNVGSLRLFINGDNRATGVSANDGQWHQICATWENGNGDWKLYKDGDMQNSGTGFKTGYTIQAEGSLVLGQEQDSTEGGFDAGQSFQGSLTNVNVWSNVLPSSTIKEMSVCCRVGEGNVYMWYDFIHAIKGNPRLVIPPTCQCAF
ncbi:neuronal pentraxin-1-like isoform X2 [Oculina patagonica]